MSHRPLGFLILTAGLLLSLPAFAYIPPSQFIVKNIALKHAGLKGLRAKSTVTSANADGALATSVRFKQTTLYDPAKRILRSRAYDEAGVELYAMERHLTAGESAAKIKETPALAIDALLVDGNLPTLMQTLAGAGIPVKSEEELLALKTEEERRHAENSFLTRSKGRPCWVIGKKDGNQLWIEKDAFLVSRLVLKQALGTQMEVQLDTQRFVRDFPVPKGISLVRVEKSETDSKTETGAAPVEKLILREDMGEITVSADVSADFKASIESGFTDAGNAASAEMRELIQNYYRFLR